MRVVSLKETVGTRVPVAYWSGTVSEALAIIAAPFHSSSPIGSPRSRFVVRLAFEDVAYQFCEEHVSTSSPGDRSSICGPVSVLDEAEVAGWPWSHGFAAGCAPWSLQLLERPDAEVLLGIDEATGRCVFEVGTEFHWVKMPSEYLAGYRVAGEPLEQLAWLHRFAPDGYDSRWLEPIDDDVKPVEIRASGYVTEVKSKGRFSRSKGDAAKHEMTRLLTRAYAAGRERGK